MDRPRRKSAYEQAQDAVAKCHVALKECEYELMVAKDAPKEVTGARKRVTAADRCVKLARADLVKAEKALKDIRGAPALQPGKKRQADTTSGVGGPAPKRSKSSTKQIVVLDKDLEMLELAEEARSKQESALKAAQEEATRKAKVNAEAARKVQEETARKAGVEAEAAQKTAAEATKKLAEETARKAEVDAEVARKVEEEAEAVRKTAAEATKKLAEETARKVQEEMARKAEEEVEAARKAAAEATKKLAEEMAREVQEEMARKAEDEMEAARVTAAEATKKLAEEAARKAKVDVEAEAARKEQEEVARKAEEEVEATRKTALDATRKAEKAARKVEEKSRKADAKKGKSPKPKKKSGEEEDAAKARLLLQIRNEFSNMSEQKQEDMTKKGMREIQDYLAKGKSLSAGVRKLIRNCPEYLPQAVMTTRALAIHALETTQKNIKCLYHYENRSHKETDMDVSLAMEKGERGDYTLTGVAGERSKDNPTNRILHCGCDTDESLMYFLIWKTWKLSAQGGAVMEPILKTHLMPRPRSAFVQGYFTGTGLCMNDMYSEKCITTEEHHSRLTLLGLRSKLNMMREDWMRMGNGILTKEEIIALVLAEGDSNQLGGSQDA